MEGVVGETKHENQPLEESTLSEKGRNVHITLKFIRHGERTPQTTLPSGEIIGGTLTDYGREVTRKTAKESKSEIGHVRIVGAMGSDAGLPGPTGMPRSLETADIYVSEINSDKRLQTRESPILNPQILVTPTPYDHNKIYNENLPENFNSLSNSEKSKASKNAQRATLDHLMSLQTPEAINYRKEIAGSFTRVIDHYIRAIKGVKSGTKALLLQGTHGGMMEPFLQELLVRRLSNGQEIHGFHNLEEIGGEFDPSESFNVEVSTDNEGNPQNLKVTFDNKDRPKSEMNLDAEKLQELKDSFISLHKKL